MLCSIYVVMIVLGILFEFLFKCLFSICYFFFVFLIVCLEMIFVFDNCLLNFFCFWVSVLLFFVGWSSYVFRGYVEFFMISGWMIVLLRFIVGFIKMFLFLVVLNILFNFKICVLCKLFGYFVEIDK